MAPAKGSFEEGDDKKGANLFKVRQKLLLTQPTKRPHTHTITRQDAPSAIILRRAKETKLAQICTDSSAEKPGR
ncbi:MAG: hypothetical protein Q9166_004181 [cf. Caloplaca sp. 2 TL-2023]